MTLADNQFQIRTGRRTLDGHVRVAAFAKGLLSITLEGRGDRAPTFLLTPDQARMLQGALSNLISLVEQPPPAVMTEGGTWVGTDRRAATSSK